MRLHSIPRPGLAALLAALAPAAPAAAQVRIDEPGRWSLQRLGYGPATIPLDGRSGPNRLPAGRVAFRYRLPPGSREGAGVWYLLRLHALVRFAPGGRRSLAYLTGATNDRTASLVKLSVPPADSNAPVRWSTSDMLNGFVERTTPGSRVEVITENFLQFAGVRPGVNTLSFTADQLGAARMRSIRILPDSGIAIMGDGPAQLSAEASASRASLRAGDAFRVRVIVANPSRRMARQIRVGVSVAGAAVGPAGPTSRRLRDLPPDGRAVATFPLRASEKGTARVVVSVDSASSSPTGVVAVRVASKPSTLEQVGRVAILVGAFGAALVLVALSLMRRPRRVG